MSQLKVLHKICLISVRKNLADFFNQFFGSIEIVSLEKKVSMEVVKKCFLAILDAEILESCSQNLLACLKQNSCSVICIIPFNASNKIKKCAEQNFKYTINYPLQKNIFVKYCEFVLDKSKQSYEIKKRECFDDIAIPDSFSGFFAGSSVLAKKLRREIVYAANNDFPILLTGETGTGKTTCANIIHNLSRRNKNKIQHLNVSTVNETLACSTFFGTEKGAYTDAVAREGIFKKANKSTVFLDEIDSASLDIQAMLLTVIESGTFKKVGGDVLETTDARIICASNANLQLLINEGFFRKDLFYRLAGHIINFPPLRDRIEDIPEIVVEFARKYNKQFSRNAICKLQEHDWPGNIRELAHCLERAKNMAAENKITANHICFNL